MRTQLMAALGLATLSLACARQHLSPAYGRATADAFALQRATASRQAPPPSMALDTQEAAAISGAYVQGLSAKESKAPEPILLVTPQRPGQAQPLAPSVPKQ